MGRGSAHERPRTNRGRAAARRRRGADALAHIGVDRAGRARRRGGRALSLAPGRAGGRACRHGLPRTRGDRPGADRRARGPTVPRHGCVHGDRRVHLRAARGALGLVAGARGAGRDRCSTRRRADLRRGRPPASHLRGRQHLAARVARVALPARVPVRVRRLAGADPPADDAARARRHPDCALRGGARPHGSDGPRCGRAQARCAGPRALRTAAGARAGHFSRRTAGAAAPRGVLRERRGGRTSRCPLSASAGGR
jgi:hypothetical protein